MAARRFNDEQFIAAVEKSSSIAEVLRALKYTVRGTGYRMVHREVARLGLDTSHFQRQRGVPPFNKIPLKKILVRGSTYTNTPSIRKRLVREGVFEERCAECGQGPRWNGKPLVLQLDHINGIRSDNRIENLRLLCPNCHTQTITFSGRKNRKTKACGCGALIKGKSQMCRACAAASRGCKIQWPPLEVLQEMVKSTSFLAVGKSLGVSDNAVRKRLRTRSRGVSSVGRTQPSQG